jgi:hypothetical protein
MEPLILAEEYRDKYVQIRTTSGANYFGKLEVIDDKSTVPKKLTQFVLRECVSIFSPYPREVPEDLGRFLPISFYNLFPPPCSAISSKKILVGSLDSFLALYLGAIETNLEFKKQNQENTPGTNIFESIDPKISPSSIEVIRDITDKVDKIKEKYKPDQASLR